MMNGRDGCGDDSCSQPIEENCQCQSPDEGVQAHPELLSGVRVSRDLESWGAVLGSPQGQNELMVVV